MSAPPDRRPLFRRAVWLGAAALLVPGVAVSASAAAPSAASPVVSAVAAPVELPTSWPAVPVAERLQPWLAGALTTAPATDPMRVMVSGKTTAAATAAATAAGLTVQQTWDKVGVVVGIGLPAQIRTVLGQPGVTYVEGDQPLEHQLDTAHTATRSQQALTEVVGPDGGRVDGSGVTIAVIDSGIDGTHPMFVKDRVSKVVRNLENVCLQLTGPSDTCYRQEPTNDTDTNSGGGHGTHVAGIAAGYEVTTSSPAAVQLRGSAPGAKLVGLSVGAAISLINANSAMTWVVDHQRKPCASSGSGQEGPIDAACPPIRATNHSYGPATAPEKGFTFDENSATVRIQRMLVTQGVTPVWAAGNSAGDGKIAQTNPPGMDPTPGVLMVASYNDGNAGNRDNQLSGFSSRGKRGDTTTYPDISAPGDSITSACRPSLAICTGSPAYDTGNYQTISGTSMATPYVAGVVAQLAQAKPLITPGEGEKVLEDTAHQFTAGAAYEPDGTRNPDHTTSFDKGHGLVDVLAAFARLQGKPVPAEPTPICTSTSAQVVDPEGDATQIIAADVNPQSQADLDITEARLVWDAAKKELTFVIKVSNLSAGGGKFFRFYVTRESDPEVFATASRNAGVDAFELRQQDGKRTALTGAFDTATNEVRIVLPAAKYGEVIAGATIADGNLIGVGQVLGQRPVGAATATADTANGVCPFTVGGAGASDPGTTPGDQPETQPTDPQVGGTPGSPGGGGGDSGSGESQPQVRSLDSACPKDRVPANSQTDDNGNTHERAIDCMVWWEIAKGTSDTQYEPGVGVTREQMAAFVARLVEKAGGKLAENPRNAFSDDDTSHHHASINKLAEAGLVDGKSGGRFAPTETVTRSQMAKFIVNAYEFVSPKTITASRDYFSDDNGDTLESFINRSAEAGFTAGRNGRYEPRLPVLRDQMASFLARTLDLLVAEGTTPAKR